MNGEAITMENNNANPLFYFSGTGTCMSVAKKLSNELPGFSLVPIAGQKNGCTVDAETVGFVFPLYFSGLPRIVADFIHTMRFERTCYIFAVVACGIPWTGYRCTS